MTQQPSTPAGPVASKPRGNSVIGSLITIGIFLFAMYYFFGGGVENKVAKDAVDEYHIAVRNGTPMDRCVHAGLVAAAYLQAKDEDNYAVWKKTENADCEAAGVPNQ